MNKWKEIWNNHEANRAILQSGNHSEIVKELKRASGWDSIGVEISAEFFEEQYYTIKKKIEEIMCNSLKSIFEVGCGCGANLYMFAEEGYNVGGIDYSYKSIESAKMIIKKAVELECVEAYEFDLSTKYDCVLSNSVFSYFPSYEYAEVVLERMYQKTNSVIAIIDIHDSCKKKQFIEHREKTVIDYKERYKNLPKLFYQKEFFENFAKKNNMIIKFDNSNMKNYWNNEFVFDCYMSKK